MTNASVESVDTSGDKCKVTIKTKKGEQLVEAGAQHGDGRGLHHQAAGWRRAASPALKPPQQGVIRPVGGLAHWGVERSHNY